jgi:hypothetical protein
MVKILIVDDHGPQLLTIAHPMRVAACRQSQFGVKEKLEKLRGRSGLEK